MRPKHATRFRPSLSAPILASQMLLGSVLMAPAALGGAPFVMGYGGRLASPSGDAIKGPVDIEIKFFRDASGGTPLPVSPIHKKGVTLNDGVFQFELDELSSAEWHLIFSSDLATWVEVTDSTNRTTYPRQKLSAVPYAFKVPTDQAAITFDGNGRLTVGAIPISKVTGLDAALALKSDSSRAVAMGDVTGLTTVLAGKADVNATLSGDVTGSVSATTVNKIRGFNVAIPTTGSTYLQYDGSGLVWSAVGGGGNMSTSQNLSGLANYATARNNLGLGALATEALVTSALITDGTITNADISGTAAIVDTKLATISTVGKVSGSAISSGTISGTTSLDITGPISTTETIYGSGNFVLKGTGSATSELRFSDADNSHYIGFKSPNSVTTSRIWTLPTSDGSVGQVLSTDGSGVLAWTTNASGISPGTSGGIPYYSSPTTLGSSGALTANGVVLGGGPGITPTATAAGTAYQTLRVPSAGGAPVFGAIDLSQSAAVANALPVANGGTGGTTASTGRSGLGAAASGANSDITSLSGLTTALSAAQGGTGATTLTSKGMLFGNGTGAISATAAGSQYEVFQAGASGIPTVGPLNLSQTAATTGSLPVDRGGTGAASLTANSVLLGNGTSAFQTVGPGPSGNILTSTGTSWSSTPPPAESWTTNGSDIYRSSGNVGIGIPNPSNKLQVAGTISSMPGSTLFPSGTTQTIDLSTSNSHNLNLGSATGTVTLTLSNGIMGTVYIIAIAQGATPRTITWPASVKWQDGTPVVLSGAYATDLITLYYNGTNYFAIATKNFQ